MLLKIIIFARLNKIEQSRYPINNITIFLASDWSLLVIASSNCPYYQSETRKMMTSLIEWRHYSVADTV